MTPMQPKKIRVLIVDDSPLVQKILSRGLGVDPVLEVVGIAGDPYEARDLLVQLRPDVMTLDIEMPRMNGLEFLRRLMPHHPLPIIMVSTHSREGARITLDCLAAGAMDFVCKPGSHQGSDTNSMLLELRAKIRAVAWARTKAWTSPASISPSRPTVVKIPGAANKMIALGSSTGGTEAIRALLKQLPPQIPGMAIVQHMPPGFTKAYAERLNSEMDLDIREAGENDILRPGTVLIAPGGLHMTVQKRSGVFQVSCSAGEKVNWHCPSVDVLMNSVATQANKMAVGIMLTGMGSDGSNGMLAMRNAGARTMAQDEATSVVFGMPRVAYEKGGAERLLPLDQIPAAILKILEDDEA